jgi:hypothetical protein
MEAVAFIAGEEFSDNPKCASPVLAAFGRRLNDALPSDQRQQLERLIPLLVGTVNPEKDQQDGLRCAHWLVTHWLPTWLDLVPELLAVAAEIRALPEPSSWSDVEGWADGWQAAKDAAREAAWDAAWDYSWNWDYAWDAAWAAAQDAAGAAAWDYAWVATRDAASAAARDSAWVGAWNSAWDAAWDVARLAARAATQGATRVATRDALQPTVNKLRQDTVDLFTELVEGRHK